MQTLSSEQRQVPIRAITTREGTDNNEAMDCLKRFPDFFPRMKVVIVPELFNFRPSLELFVALRKEFITLYEAGVIDGGEVYYLAVFMREGKETFTGVEPTY